MARIAAAGDEEFRRAEREVAREWEAFRKAVMTTLERTVACGERLHEAQALLPAGQTWAGWLARMGIPRSTAADHIKLWKCWEKAKALMAERGNAVRFTGAGQLVAYIDRAEAEQAKAARRKELAARGVETEVAAEEIVTEDEGQDVAVEQVAAAAVAVPDDPAAYAVDAPTPAPAGCGVGGPPGGRVTVSASDDGAEDGDRGLAATIERLVSENLVERVDAPKGQPLNLKKKRLVRPVVVVPV
jgi:hypothetical protein